MEKYEIYFEKKLVGILEINEQNQYRFTPEDWTKDTNPELPFDYSKFYDWGDPIPFLKNRIERWKKFVPEWDVFGHITDDFRLRKVKA